MSGTDGIRVDVINGRMQAVLFIDANAAPELITAELCQQAIRAEGVVLTAEVAKRIDEAVATFQEDPSAGVEEIIAQGNEPIHGDNGRIDWMEGFNPDDDSNTHPVAEGEDGRIDFYNATSAYIAATEGGHIATLIEPTDGMDGAAVDGGTVKAQAGKPFKVRVDETIILNGNNEFIAQRNGLISYEEHFLRILDVLVIDGHVDFSSGNIDFEGDVVIHKGVRDRFIVECTGELEIRGLIEAATIITMSNAQFMRGMAAKERGTINIGGDLQARYLDNVHGRVQSDLRIEKEMCACHLCIGRSLFVEHGAMVGGLVEVGKSAKISVLGAAGSARTILRVGSIPELTEGLQKIESLLPRLAERIDGIKLELEQLIKGSGRASPAQREKITELQFELQELMRRHDDMEVKKIEIDSMIERFANVDVEISKRLHAGTRFQIGSEQYRVRADVKGPIRIHYNTNRKLMITDLAGNSSQEFELFAELEPFGAGDEDDAVAA